MSKLYNYLFSSTQNNKHAFSEGITVAVAESVTAGAVSTILCSEPGSSSFFKGGVICYNPSSKREILGIDTAYAELNNHANPLTTSEMAQSVAKKFNARIGIATTGYSLPTYRPASETECELDIKVPYALVCLFDTKMDLEVVKRYEYTYDEKLSKKLNRSYLQANVAVETKKLFNSYLKKCDMDYVSVHFDTPH